MSITIVCISGKFTAFVLCIFMEMDGNGYYINSLLYMQVPHCDCNAFHMSFPPLDYYAGSASRQLENISY
jgi:hypothetical protein